MNIPIEVNIEKTTCNKLFLLNNKNKIENSIIKIVFFIILRFSPDSNGNPLVPVPKPRDGTKDCSE